MLLAVGIDDIEQPSVSECVIDSTAFAMLKLFSTIRSAHELLALDLPTIQRPYKMEQR